jgi:hypothetical protein
VALHKYRVGRSCPSRNRNFYKSRVEIQLLTRIWLRAPIRPSGPIGQTGQGAGLVLTRTITPSYGLRTGCPTYAFRSTWRGLRNGEVQLAFWALWSDRSDRCGWKVRPVRAAESAIWPITKSDQLAFSYQPKQPLLTIIILSTCPSWSSWQKLHLGALEPIIWDHLGASPNTSLPSLWNYIQNFQDDPLVM